MDELEPYLEGGRESLYDLYYDLEDDLEEAWLNGEISYQEACEIAEEMLDYLEPYLERERMSFYAELEEACINGEISYQEACEIAERLDY